MCDPKNRLLFVKVDLKSSHEQSVSMLMHMANMACATVQGVRAVRALFFFFFISGLRETLSHWREIVALHVLRITLETLSQIDSLLPADLSVKFSEESEDAGANCWITQKDEFHLKHRHIGIVGSRVPFQVPKVRLNPYEEFYRRIVIITVIVVLKSWPHTRPMDSEWKVSETFTGDNHLTMKHILTHLTNVNSVKQHSETPKQSFNNGKSPLGKKMTHIPPLRR